MLLNAAEGWIVHERSGLLDARPLDGSGAPQRVSSRGSLAERSVRSGGLVQYVADGIFRVRVLRSGRDVVLGRPAVDDAMLGPAWFALAQADGSAVLYERDKRQSDVLLGDDVIDLVELPDETLAVTHSSGLVERWMIDERTGLPGREELLAGVDEVITGESDHVIAARRSGGSIAFVDLRSNPPSVHETGEFGASWIALTQDWAFIAHDLDVAGTTLWAVAGDPRKVAELPGRPLDFDIESFTAGQLDATRSWVLLERPEKDGYEVDLWYLRGTPTVTELGGVRDGRWAWFSGRHLVYADDAGWTKVFGLRPEATGLTSDLGVRSFLE